MTSQVIVTLLVAVFSSSGMWGFLQWKLEAKENKKQKQLDEIHSAILEMQTEISANKDLSLSLGRDRVNHLCNNFIELGYIPKEDNISFLLIGASYCAYGNTEVKTKFEWVKENLPVK